MVEAREEKEEKRWKQREGFALEVCVQGWTTGGGEGGAGLG